MYGREWCRLHIFLENGGGEPEAEELDWTVEQLSVGLMKRRWK